MATVNNFYLKPIDVRRDIRKLVTEAFSYIPRGAKVFDVGCGDAPFSSAIKDLGLSYVGVDLAKGFYSSEFVDLVGSAYAVPAEDGVADAVLLVQVIEHLDRPEDAFSEAFRLLKPGGILIVSSPFLYPIHAPPFDYMRYTQFYLSAIADKKGFKLLKQMEVSGFWYSLGVNIALYLHSFNKGVIERAGLITFVTALLQWIVFFVHNFEGFIFDLIGKKRNLRSIWPVNYVFVLQKNILEL